jgi:DNA-binding NarL/FixJ family response regulator
MNALKSNLTERETQILALIARGLSSQQIAHKLEISFETVKVHRRNMLKKAKTHNTFELIRLAIQRRWI